MINMKYISTINIEHHTSQIFVRAMILPIVYQTVMKIKKSENGHASQIYVQTMIVYTQ